MKVLSLFDGISCLQLALQRCNITVEEYYASEIKKSAIKVTQYHFPNTIQIGDIRKVHYKDGVLYTENGNFNVGSIDLVGGGSPCQDFSVANMVYKHGYGLDGDKSSLFYEYLRILKEVNPKYFLLENVRMKKESKKQLDNYLGVIGIEINSSLVSYQNRHRIYWTNFKFEVAKDRHISFQDYKEVDIEECRKYKLPKTKSRIEMWNNGMGRDGGLRSCLNVTNSDKIYTITRKQDRSPNSGLVEFEDFCRFLTREELEQGQTLPVGYTNMLSYNQAQDVIGDAWTVDVIVEILKGIKEDNYGNC